MIQEKVRHEVIGRFFRFMRNYVCSCLSMNFSMSWGPHHNVKGQYSGRSTAPLSLRSKDNKEFAELEGPANQVCVQGNRKSNLGLFVSLSHLLPVLTASPVNARSKHAIGKPLAVKVRQ